MGDNLSSSSKNIEDWPKSVYTRSFWIGTDKFMSSNNFSNESKLITHLWPNKRSTLNKNLIVYQSLLGKLIYLACRTQPFTAFIVEQLSCDNFNPCLEYIYIVKQVL